MAGLFRREGRYDRRKLLANAAKARKRGKTKRAIESYRRVLETEPHDTEVHRKIAPLLARVGHHQVAGGVFLVDASAVVDVGLAVEGEFTVEAHAPVPGE